MNDTHKTCWGCRHHKDNFENYCYYPSVTRVDVVTGRTVPGLCYKLRESGGFCGLDGRLWEPQEAAS